MFLHCHLAGIQKAICFVSGLRAFDDNWPLDYVTSDCIVNRKNRLLRDLSITEKTIGYVSATHAGDILPRGMTLLDILCDQGCISSTHKRFIEEQPTNELRGAALIQMLVTGSIKTYKTTVAYLRDTDQCKSHVNFTEK